MCRSIKTIRVSGRYFISFDFSCFFWHTLYVSKDFQTLFPVESVAIIQVLSSCLWHLPSRISALRYLPLSLLEKETLLQKWLVFRQVCYKIVLPGKIGLIYCGEHRPLLNWNSFSSLSAYSQSKWKWRSLHRGASKLILQEFFCKDLSFFHTKSLKYHRGPLAGLYFGFLLADMSKALSR